nr:MAG TPA: hypothetical protein [Caudoviricetes sp.]
MVLFVRLLCVDGRKVHRSMVYYPLNRTTT